MNIIALKMLVGNKGALIGVIFGVFLATLLISQQSAIFLGLISRSYRMVSDVPIANIWVTDPSTESDQKVRTMPRDYVNVVRGVPGVEWAIPLNITHLPLVTPSGTFDLCEIYGIDDASLIGGPTEMVEGSVSDLRRADGIIVDIYSAGESLARTLPDGTKIPLKVGDALEINSRKTVVVGICQTTRGFYPEPIIFTTYSKFVQLNPSASNRVGFILTKTLKDADSNAVIKRIDSLYGLHALTREQFKARIVKSFLETGILINFALSVVLAFVVGLSIAGQTFYMMTEHNLTYYALVKALGATKKMILLMITLQVLLVGAIGFLLGIAATLLWGMAIKNTTLAFYFPWQLLVSTGLIVLVICLFTAIVSIRKVFLIDPKMLMGN